ncbi:class I SAM-dependent DNA methyltransferase [Atopomonas sediminilitoris]|uniref:class I SAM-dependent DNA methyltransferase n=1 Tax=Atopomonas sediminilitoris TaxID=2919919 RepID=UPI001F4E135B|nr:DNA methyltransferase [Atopomonas sediminilitoris]MCJ8168505.1 class I SAM-dependent DNA methyltransferase [Atopomonas sediminilitoris]
MEHLDTFLARWKDAGGTERANYQLFLTELCSLLGLPLPEPAGDDTRDNAYVFERRVVINQPDGSSNNGFIDLYKRGSFVLEAKQTGKTLDSSGWDKAMLKAHNQADQYARALPAEEGRPPFILVVDVGRNIELYAEFSRSGATYTPYPDSRSHRIRLEDLRKEDVRERLSAVWLDPLSLDPARRSAKVTREIADQLAKLAKSLEAAGHSPQLVSSFLMRALFTMFAEDVGLLPERGFTELLQRLKNKPDTFAPMLEHLWQTMNSGGFSPILESTVLKFNGGLFAEASAIALDRDQMELLLKASEADWRHVEPAIFGTLLERALNPRERHKLGAHYTPRAYVERLVLPTVIEPLRAEWKEVQAAALTYESLGKHKEAIAEVKAFQRHLCDVRVLDPACGSGNFLYVTLEHMKRLEGEVLNLLGDLGQTGMLDTEGLTVDPHQFLGMEINPRAARIAEMVLWIGYLQWHFRTHGKVNPPEPVLRDFHNIEHRDALIAYDAVELLRDETGKPITSWDGITTKTSPITDEQVPDESAQVEQYIYRNPRKAEWPQADYIVGNPPFIGNKRMRTALGDGYVDAVRGTWPEVPESADFVMYWWHIAAETTRAGQAKRFGFITTNSIKQTFNRRILEAQISAKKPLSLAYAIPDHPWVDAGDGAAVRIAMTVGTAESLTGCLSTVVREEASEQESDVIDAQLVQMQGAISADLSVGAKVSAAQPLKASAGTCFQGVKLVGDGFRLTPETRSKLLNDGADAAVIREYWTGSDLTKVRQPEWVIDFFGLEQQDAECMHPLLYQRLLTEVKPFRDHVNRKAHRERWWLFGEARPGMRAALSNTSSFIATSEVAKHRLFVLLDSCTALADGSLMAIALDSPLFFGVLSSRLHALWAFAAGGTLEDRARYTKNHCFETFPFPDATHAQQARIYELAERLDAHRKRQQAQHPGLTLTGMYNVLEKLRAGEQLNAKDKTIHEQGLVSLLRELHDELDRAVFAAYGWSDLAEQLAGKPGATTPLPDKSEAQAEAEEELLCRLVALNSERAAEEARGHIRWLRPEYQNPSAAVAPEQSEAELDDTTDFESIPAAAAATGKLTWPKQMREQVAAVRHALGQSPLPADALAAQFKRSPKVAVQAVLDALEELGMVQQDADQYRLAS